ncbi:hypothetical protein Y032_0421g1163 [Ancylostoma ceylanicum]|uniref:Uncharacterized protein n=1 Tax=Ancylostoma ceylanicum TaxID=53326 RepID=A0A016X308_9BILA|nr:hypothetical protein Y032_0421g1163 [Ancylostoma ceylanicum]
MISARKMSKTLLLLLLIPISHSLKCRKFSNDGQDAAEEIPENTYCSFIMPPPCEKGIFIEGNPWSHSQQEEICAVTEENVFSCACYSKDFCSSDYEGLMSIWKKSPGYSENEKYTKCLEHVIDAAKHGFTHPHHSTDDHMHMEVVGEEDYHVASLALSPRNCVAVFAVILLAILP